MQVRRIRYLLAGALLWGCSSPQGDLSPSADPGLVHAVIAVERSSSTGAETDRGASALVGVVRVPPTIDSRQVVRLVGLADERPPLGTCEVTVLASRASPSLIAFERVEFLDVGDVWLSVGSQRTPLARQAFPTVTDYISGVLYTTRDRAAAALPPASRYHIESRGGSGVPPFSVDVDAPDQLTHVSVNGMELGELTQLNASEEVKLAWNAGRAGDEILAELEADSNGTTADCTFDDSLGRAVIPASLFKDRGPGRLTIRRVRRANVNLAGVDRSELRFDFETSQPVQID